MTNAMPINPNLISVLVSVLPSISAASIATNPIAQAGVDIVGKSLGWQQPPSVISSPSVRMLLQGSPAAVTGGAIALKTFLTTEITTAMAAAPAAGACAIGAALMVGVVVGTGLDYGVGAVLNDKRIDTLSEWLATKWAEASSLPLASGWRYIPQNAPSGAPTDPIRSPGERGSPITAPGITSVEEMEMKRKKEETIGDPPTSPEVLLVAGPGQSDHRGIIHSILGSEDTDPFYVAEKLSFYARTHLNGNLDAILQILEEPHCLFPWTVEILGYLGGDPRLRGDLNRLEMTLQNSGVANSHIIAALGEIGSNPHYPGNLDHLIREIRYLNRDVGRGDFLVTALGKIGSNPLYRGDFSFLGAILDSRAPESLVVQSIADLGRNPNFDPTGGAWDPNYWVDAVIARGKRRDYSGRSRDQTLALLSLATNPNFKGDFAHVLNNILDESLRDELRRMEEPNFTDFLIFLGKPEKCFASIGVGRFLTALFTARLFAHYASEPNLSAVRRVALADAIIGGFSHSNPSIREAFQKVAPNIVRDEKIAPWARELFREGAL